MDIEWEIVPFEHVGPLSRATTREEVSQLLDEVPRTVGLYKSEETFDAFQLLGVHCYYDDDDRVRFVILHERDSTRCTWDGVPLLGRPLVEVIDVLAREPFERQAGQDPEDEFTGFVSALYEPFQVFLYSAPDSGGVITSVSVDLRGGSHDGSHSR